MLRNFIVYTNHFNIDKNDLQKYSLITQSSNLILKNRKLYTVLICHLVLTHNIDKDSGCHNLDKDFIKYPTGNTFQLPVSKL